MSTNLKIKYDLSKRLYPITELIQKTAVKRAVSVVQVREELAKHCDIGKSLLCMLENAKRHDKKPRLLQLKQEIKMNDYFREHLENNEIFVIHLTPNT